tara:strand:- start:505 stop:1002 length:498 start_codon:yes stop_codon:yes gene_type:complete
MWIWGKSREIPDRVGEFDPDAIIAEAEGRPFIIEYLFTAAGSDNLHALYFRPRYESTDYDVYVLTVDSTGIYGEDVPFYWDDQGVVHNNGFIQDYNEVWKRIENEEGLTTNTNCSEERLIELLFAYNNLDHYGEQYVNTPLLITFATEPKPYASINRWYLPKHLG